jgi:transmembrane sensor
VWQFGSWDGICGAMPEPDSIPVPQDVHDRAADWVERRQRDTSPDLAERLNSWLAADPKHRVAFQLAQRQWEDSRLLDHSPLARDRQLVRAPFLMRQSTHRMLVGVGGAAALALAAIGLVPVLSPPSLIPAAEAQRFETGRGEIKHLRLDDGSRVTLDTTSSVVVHNYGGVRRIELEGGRARFASAAGRSLEVVAGSERFQAENATFDVDLTGSKRLVMVLRGHVKAQPRNNEHAVSMSIEPASRDPDVAGPDGQIGTQPQWPSGMLSLDGTRLDHAIAAINRYNVVQIAISPTLADLRMTGAFKVRDPVGFARTVAALYHLRLARTGSRLTLSGDN